MSVPERRTFRAQDLIKNKYHMERGFEIRKRRRRLYLILAILSIILLYVLLTGLNRLVDQKTGTTGTSAAKASLLEEPKKIPLAKVEGRDLMLYLPSPVENVYGIGFHQAYNKRSYSFRPVINFLEGEPAKELVDNRALAGSPISFVMSTRGRGTSPTSSVDVSLQEGSEVLSPVDGVIVDVVPYKLYGRIDDFRIEIKADGYEDFKIVIAHVTDVIIGKGRRVEKSRTKLATVRSLGINSQINEYIKSTDDHVHIQINPM